MSGAEKDSHSTQLISPTYKFLFGTIKVESEINMVAEPSRSAGEINWGTTGTEPNQLVHDLLQHVKPDSTSRPGTLDESMASFLASATNPEEVSQDTGIADDDIVKMIWRMRAVLNNLGYSLKDNVDEHNT